MPLTLLDWRRDPKLFGALPHHRDPRTQVAWDSYIAAVRGYPMTPEMLDIFRRCTGLDAPRPGGYRFPVFVGGRQCGKTITEAESAIYDAVTAGPESRGRYVPIVAQDQRGGTRALFAYIRQIMTATRMLASMIESQTSDTITLANGVGIPVYPARPSAVRGIIALAAKMDEPPHMITSEGRPTDVEMRRALLYTLATTGGRLSIFSSPTGQTGLLYDLHRRSYGRESGETLVWCADAPTMNPSLGHDYLAKMAEADPEGYRSEVLGEFGAGHSTLFDGEALDACTADWRELPPCDGVRYFGAYDASGGRRDASAGSIGHAEGKTIIGDVCRAWPAPHNPASAIAEAAALFKTYRIQEIEADRYAGDFVTDAFRAHGIRCLPAPLDRSGLYLELLPTVNAGGIAIPNDPALLRELRGLERRRGANRDKVDHRQGGHDDRATAFATMVHMITRRTRSGSVSVRVVGY